MERTKRTRRYKRHGQDALRTRIEALANAGWKPPQIAAEVNRTPGYVHIVLSQLRKNGRLPSRKP